MNFGRGWRSFDGVGNSCAIDAHGAGRKPCSVATANGLGEGNEADGGFSDLLLAAGGNGAMASGSMTPT